MAENKTPFEIVASELGFPEGPVWEASDSLLLVEISTGWLTRIRSGERQPLAALGGSPNGAAIGPDGACYVCNSGGFRIVEMDGLTFVDGEPDDYSGGRIERVNVETGEFDVLYSDCNGNPLKGPNDLVFDSDGGFWFTDTGKTRRRDMDLGGIYYASCDGSSIEELIYPVITPNGIGLSPDEKTLYFAETVTGNVKAVDLAGPGQLAATTSGLPPGRVHYRPPGQDLYDSLAVDSAGNICVATLLNGGITVIPPEGGRAEHIALPDMLTTNICFGGRNLQTAYVTLASTGRLIAMPWRCPGLPLAFGATATK
jgi:gluconolactonase